MAKSKVIVKDLGFKEVMQQLLATGKLHITVGVHGDVGARKDGPSQVLVAAANEFGTKDGRVPERSYMRSTVDARRGDLALLMTKQLGVVADGKRTAKDAAEIAGLFMSSAIKKTLTDLSDPPNAPSTIARKGSSNPLIDTGQLRASITHKVVDGRPPPKGGG